MTQFLVGNVRCEALGDDFSACFCRDSGQTHLLDAFSAAIIELMMELGDAQTFNSLSEQLQIASGLPADDIEERTRGTLDVLVNLHLVKRHHAAG